MKQLMPIALLGMAIAATPLFGDQAAQPAGPGAVNYVEGKAYLDGRQLSQENVGNAQMNAGQELTTEQGKAEILLTPGVFLRVGDNSDLKMISPDITPTQIELVRGHAALEVDELHNENDLEVTTAGVTTRIVKTGYYEFNADRPSVMVYKGEARVEEANGKSEKVKGSHEIALVQGAESKSAKFDTDDAQDSLYQWSKLRSQYLAEENQQIAGEYAGVAGFTPGWYGNPYGYGYTFIGADPFFSPFGWGFYPPWWGGFYGGGYWGGGYYGRPYGGFRGPVGHYGGRGFSGRGFQGGPVHGSGGFHGGAMRGGGFQGGGGFHGGGGGRGGHR
jgi:hypothetical protein